MVQLTAKSENKNTFSTSNTTITEQNSHPKPDTKGAGACQAQASHHRLNMLYMPSKPQAKHAVHAQQASHHRLNMLYMPSKPATTG